MIFPKLTLFSYSG